jgi:electron transport complex protein RnfD
MAYTELKKSCGKLTLNPFSYAGWSMGTVSRTMIFLLLAQVFLLCVTESWKSVAIVFSALSASVLTETAVFFAGRKVSWEISVVQGILIGLLVPAECSCGAVFFTVFFTLLLGKYVFGGFSESWANLAALCIAILYFLDAESFKSFSISVSDLQSKNPSLSLIQNGTFPLIRSDSAITEFLNSTVFKFFGVSVPDGYVSFFWDNGSSIPAFRFNLLTIFSSMVLLVFDMIDFCIPLIFLTVYSVLVRFVSPFISGGIPFQGDLLLSLLTGGTLFCTFFLLQWYGTLPVTRKGKIFFAILAGTASFLIMGFGLSSAGYVFVVLLMNLVSLGIQVFEDKKLHKDAVKKLLPRIRELRGE